MKVSFPPAFENRMKDRLGEEFDLFKESHLSQPPVSMRINPGRSGFTDTFEKIPWAEYGRYLDARPVFTLDPLFHAGAYYVQEASSMFLEQVIRQTVDLRQPLRALDLCAAPGGKSTHSLSLLSPDSLLVANEVIRSRVNVLSENLQKWGNANVVITNNDPRDFQVLKGYFDLIVVDAPCSGEGLFRKDPDAMNEWTPENAAMCSVRQERILHDILPCLRQNGVLIYCTCTYNEEENERNVSLLADVGCEAIEIKTAGLTGIAEIRKKNCIGYQLYPHRIQGEGFFIAAVRKIASAESSATRAKPSFSFATKKLTLRLADWLVDPLPFEFILQDDLFLMITARYSKEIEYMAHHLRVITKGTAMATIKHDKLIPEHSFALSLSLKRETFMVLEVDNEQAIRYLRKDPLTISDDRKGFAVVSFKDFSLGWVNLLGNRINNLYPNSWRIRMGSGGPHSTT